MTTLADISNSFRTGETPPDRAIQYRATSSATSGNRLLKMRLLWDEYDGIKTPSPDKSYIDSLLDLSRKISDDWKAFTFPLDAISITSSTTMHELCHFGQEGYWERVNNRRIFLINREYNSSLSDSENEELERLQARFASYMDAISPLPFAELEAFEARIDEQRSEGNHCSDSPI